jgi:hypothetical protein
MKVINRLFHYNKKEHPYDNQIGHNQASPFLKLEKVE